MENRAAKTWRVNLQHAFNSTTLTSMPLTVGGISTIYSSAFSIVQCTSFTGTIFDLFQIIITLCCIWRHRVENQLLWKLVLAFECITALGTCSTLFDAFSCEGEVNTVYSISAPTRDLSTLDFHILHQIYVLMDESIPYIKSELKSISFFMQWRTSLSRDLELNLTVFNLALSFLSTLMVETEQKNTDYRWWRFLPHAAFSAAEAPRHRNTQQTVYPMSHHDLMLQCLHF